MKAKAGKQVQWEQDEEGLSSLGESDIASDAEGAYPASLRMPDIRNLGGVTYISSPTLLFESSSNNLLNIAILHRGVEDGILRAADHHNHGCAREQAISCLILPLKVGIFPFLGRIRRQRHTRASTRR